VLDTTLSYREQTLLLLYSEIHIGLPTEDLTLWTEHPNAANYRRDVLSRLHKARLIEWDRETEMAILSPLGAAEVENAILPKISQAQPGIKRHTEGFASNSTLHRTPTAPPESRVCECSACGRRR